ncbi:MAG TPA: methyl-accepting chemotaxis protein [Sphingomonas sp.]|nr:methyl-accepting chemotaxis protein [Sphingomonas sp.]
MNPLLRLTELVRGRARLADRSLVVKFAAAPVAMLILFGLAILLSVAALLHAKASTAKIVGEDMHHIAQLNAISARFERADSDLYHLLVAKAAGGRVDVSAQSETIKRELSGVRHDLISIRSGLAESRAQIDRTIVQVDKYAGAVDVVTSMLDIDFASSATMLAPFRSNAKQVVHDVNAIADAGIAEAQHDAALTQWRIGLMVALVLLSTVLIAALGVIATLAIGRATIGSITEIAAATSRLAAADYFIDLEALNRGDELGAVVTALKTFRHQALEAQRLALEKQALERQSYAEDQRRLDAVAQVARDNENARRAELAQLADQFEAKVASMIRGAQLAMEKLGDNSAHLDASAGQNRDLAAQLEQIAAAFAGEMENAGIATGALTSSIREIDREVAKTSDVAQSILERATHAQDAVSDSEEKAEQIARVVDVIDQIANQTNLLALNATIEAARSGEAGRGFAVVAAEIKQLSNRTGSSTKDVRREIGEVQQRVRRVVQATAELNELIADMNDVTSRVATVSRDQARSTNAIDEMVGAIRTRARELTDASAVIRASAIDNQSSVQNLRAASVAVQQSLADLGRDAQSFTRQLRAS